MLQAESQQLLKALPYRVKEAAVVGAAASKLAEDLSLIHSEDFSLRRPTDDPGTQWCGGCTDQDPARAVVVPGERTVSIPQC